VGSVVISVLLMCMTIGDDSEACIRHSRGTPWEPTKPIPYKFTQDNGCKLF